ncbi:TonB-dependent receptor family protein [Chitinophaga defluvii]|uniref:TonB-dependent receptor family protein n=1 Tax=Chitinophaga defluvii TaxID=3163343 RepID=A0ABV2T3Z1_9BACT
MIKNGIIRISCLLGLLLPVLAYGQQTGRHSLKAQIISQSNMENLPYASIVIKSAADSSFVKGGMTDLHGKIQLKDIPAGHHLVLISLLGYQNKQVSWDTHTHQDLDLGKVQLIMSTAALSTVEVAAKKNLQSQSPEKLVFDVTQHISARGGTVLETMKALPGVTIDNEGNIVLRGSKNVQVLVDGRQSGITGFDRSGGLDQIPASAIEAIEIINNPSAKYNPDQMAGIINIKFKKDYKKGLNGQAGLTLGTRQKYNPSLSLNYRTGKVNLFAQADARWRKFVKIDKTVERTELTAGKPSRYIPQHYRSDNTQNEQIFKAGIDYFFNERNTLTFFTLYKHEFHRDMGKLNYDLLDANKVPQSGYKWNYNEPERNKAFDYALLYKHQFKQPGQTLHAELIYTSSEEDERFTFDKLLTTDFANFQRIRNERSALLEAEGTFNAKVSYLRPLGKGTLETGVNSIIRNISVDFAYDTLDLNTGIYGKVPDIGSFSRYTTQSYAVYGNYELKTTGYELEAGLRLEQFLANYRVDPSNPVYRSNSYDFLKPYPSVRYTKILPANNRLSVYYNYRINRPVLSDLRPYPKYDDPVNLKTGNPNLRPEFVHAVEIAWQKTFANSSITTSLYHKIREHIISPIAVLPETGTDNITAHVIPENINGGTNTGLELIYSTDLFPWWKLNVNGSTYLSRLHPFHLTNAYGQTISGTQEEIISYNAKMVSQFLLPAGFSLQAVAYYVGADLVPQGKSLDRFALDMGIEKQLFKNGKLSISATDLFKTLQFGSNINGTNFSLYSRDRYETRIIYAGYTHKF